MNTKERAALKLVLLFHYRGEWTTDHRTQWANCMATVLGRSDIPNRMLDATSRTLCDAVRVALGQLDPMEIKNQ